jgi:hypothetical protein
MPLLLSHPRQWSVGIEKDLSSSHKPQATSRKLKTTDSNLIRYLLALKALGWGLKLELEA